MNVINMRRPPWKPPYSNKGECVKTCQELDRYRRGATGSIIFPALPGGTAPRSIERGARAYPEGRWGKDGKTSHHLRAMLLHGPCHPFRLEMRWQAREAQQQNPAVQSSVTINQISKVLVGCDQKSIRRRTKFQDFIVRDTWCKFRYILDAMTAVPEFVNDWPVNIFIRDKNHAAFSGTGYTTSACKTVAAKPSAARTASCVRRGWASRM